MESFTKVFKWYIPVTEAELEEEEYIRKIELSRKARKKGRIKLEDTADNLDEESSAGILISGESFGGMLSSDIGGLRENRDTRLRKVSAALEKEKLRQIQEKIRLEQAERHKKEQAIQGTERLLESQETREKERDELARWLWKEIKKSK